MFRTEAERSRGRYVPQHFSVPASKPVPKPWQPRPNPGFGEAECLPGKGLSLTSEQQRTGKERTPTNAKQARRRRTLEQLFISILIAANCKTKANRRDAETQRTILGPNKRTLETNTLNLRSSGQDATATSASRRLCGYPFPIGCVETPRSSRCPWFPGLPRSDSPSRRRRIP